MGVRADVRVGGRGRRLRASQLNWPPLAGITPAFSTKWLHDLRDHLTRREAVPRPRGRAAARGPPQDGRGQDVPSGHPLRSEATATASSRRQRRGDRQGRRPCAGRQDPDRQVPAEDRLQAAYRFPRAAFADRDPVDRHRLEARRRQRRRRRRRQRLRRRAAAHPVRGYDDLTVAEVTERSKRWRLEQLEATLEYEKQQREPQGRDRRARACDRGKAGEGS